MSRLPLAFALLAVTAWAQPKTEVGAINGAAFRIDVAGDWNGGLVIYCHGYNGAPEKFDAAKAPPIVQLFVGKGYAVAQSGYGAGGFAVQEAVTDTEELRRYFIKKYGSPKETWVTGHSMGGLLTMMLMETYPNVYDGGLALCGPLAPSNWFLERHFFDLAVVYEYFFPGVLPSPARVPPAFAGGTQKTAEILRLLEENPAKAQALRSFSHLRTNRDLAGLLVFATLVLKELQQRWGGNPVDNCDTVYTGLGDDNAVNDGVKRYAADPRAAEAAARFYTPTGRIARPLLAIHTTYDPIVPAWVPNEYAGIARQAGRGGLFVQQYVKHDGHCAITSQEVWAGFEELNRWTHGGERPKPGAVPAR